MSATYQRVEGLRTVWERQTVSLPDQFQLRTDRKHVWLQKIAIWVLRKLGCFAFKIEQVAIKHTIDTQKLVEKIMIQDRALAELYHYGGSMVLVGHQEFAELQMLELNHPLSISAQYMWQEPDRTSREIPYKMHRTACNLHVVLIPWMKGVLVLPKDFDQNRMH